MTTFRTIVTHDDRAAFIRELVDTFVTRGYVPGAQLITQVRPDPPNVHALITTLPYFAAEIMRDNPNIIRHESLSNYPTAECTCEGGHKPLYVPKLTGDPARDIAAQLIAASLNDDRPTLYALGTAAVNNAVEMKNDDATREHYVGTLLAELAMFAHLTITAWWAAK